MARRKINLQNIGESSPTEKIDDMVRGLGTTDLGFTPTGQSIYEIDLEKVFPDPKQPRYILPGDIRLKMSAREITPREAMDELVRREHQGDVLAHLILGRPDEIDEVDEDDERGDVGLRALAYSIQDVGLRQPINVYSVASVDVPGEMNYQIAEGERRYWAHHLLVSEGKNAFARIRCVIEPLPSDELLIRRRQQAENAARQDLSAIARARAIREIRDRLRVELGTRVPGETTIKLPSQRELDEAVGKEVKAFAGRAIGGRMVRNYLRLLQLPQELQDVAEAASLSEKQLRPIMKIPKGDEQRRVMMQILEGGVSGRAVADMVGGNRAVKSMKQVSVLSSEERMERRLFQAAKTVADIGVGDDYLNFISMLSRRVAADDGVGDAVRRGSRGRWPPRPRGSEGCGRDPGALRPRAEWGG